MSVSAWTRCGNRWGGAARFVCALGAAGALVASCSSSNEGTPTFPAFVAEDCRGGLVELARLKLTFAVSISRTGAGSNLALEGDTLFMMYAFAATESGLPPSGGIVAVPVAGGDARVVAAAQDTSQWGAGSFWVSGGRIYLQTGSAVLSFPVDSPPPAGLPVMLAPAVHSAYAHDAEFGYSAWGQNSLLIMKTPLAGGEATVLADEPLPDGALGGMADAGDALLLHVRWSPDSVYGGPTFTRVWRIPKDGGPRSDVRPDIVWADALALVQWLAWDGVDILGPINVQNYAVIARVPAAGTSAPEYVKLNGAVATRRGDEILSFQMVATGPVQTNTIRLLVASSKGAPGGTVIACGGEHASLLHAVPAGIAANDGAIYVSYQEMDDTVIARVAP